MLLGQASHLAFQLLTVAGHSEVAVGKLKNAKAGINGEVRSEVFSPSLLVLRLLNHFPRSGVISSKSGLLWTAGRDQRSTCQQNWKGHRLLWFSLNRIATVEKSMWNEESGQIGRLTGIFEITAPAKGRHPGSGV